MNKSPIIQLSVSLPKVPPQLSHQEHLFVRMEDQISKISDETEEQNFTHFINFQTCLKIPYEFWRLQPLKFSLFNKEADSDLSLLGCYTIELNKLLFVDNDTHTAILTLEGTQNQVDISIKYLNPGATSTLMKMTWQVAKLKKDKGLWKRNPKLVFSKLTPTGEMEAIYSTEVAENTLEATFKLFEVDLGDLCNNDNFTKFSIACYNFSRKNNLLKLLGQTLTTLNDIKTHKEIEILNKGKPAGVIHLMSYEATQKYQLIDFLKGGMELNLIFGIDFTSSNGDHQKPNTLHSIVDPTKLNDYQKAMNQIGAVLLKYNKAKEITALGFGAKPNFPKLSSQQVSHCFPLTGDMELMKISGTDGLDKAYRNALFSVNMWGPTIFSEILEEGIKSAKSTWSNKLNVYHVLIILTDGELHDFDASADKLKEMSNLPISTVFIGIGNEDFSNISHLNKNSLQENANLRECSQFLALRNYSHLDEMVKECLNTVSLQICHFMKIQGKKPTHLESVPIVTEKHEEEKQEDKTQKKNLIVPGDGNNLNQRKSRHFENIEKLYKDLDHVKDEIKLSNETISTDFL
jgi:hypothetical protein